IRVDHGKVQRFQWTTPTGGKTIFNGVFSLLSEKNKPLLIGARSGIFRFEHGRIEKSETDQRVVRQMIRSRSGQLWLAGSLGVFRSFQRDQSGPRAPESEWLVDDVSDGLDAATYSILEDSSGRMWLGTNM